METITHRLIISKYKFELICPALGNGNSFRYLQRPPNTLKFEFICPALGNGNQIIGSFSHCVSVWIYMSRVREWKLIWVNYPPHSALHISLNLYVPALGNGNLTIDDDPSLMGLVWIYMSRVREWKPSRACFHIGNGVSLNLYVPR